VTARCPLVLALSLVSLACGASVRSTLPAEPAAALTGTRRVFVALGTAGAGISSEIVGMGSAASAGSAEVTSPGSAAAAGSTISSGVSSTSVKSGAPHAELALQRLQHELIGMGFVLVDDPAQADLIAEFSIATIRYDPLVGWIADEANLVFRESGTRQIVASFHADTRWITPRVGTLVDRLAEAVRDAR
jgi:hypothetical protein